MSEKKRSTAYGWVINLQDGQSFPDPRKVRSWLLNFGAVFYVFQKEKGEEKGRRHYQGYVQFKKRIYWKKWLENGAELMGLNIDAFQQEYEQFHATEEEYKEGMGLGNYCKKEDRLPGPPEEVGPWTFGEYKQCGRPKKVDQRKLNREKFCKWYKEKFPVLHDWQQKLLDDTKEWGEPNDRKVIWIYDPAGGAGKTLFGKYLKYQGNTIKASRSAKHIILEWSKRLDKGEDVKTIIWDITRSHGKIDYEGIEMLKSGDLGSEMFDNGGVESYHAPHIIIFSNEEPTTSKFTDDRWDIRQISKPKEKYEEFIIRKRKRCEISND